jgi:hypothetical protein
MKKPPRVALIAAGKIAGSPITRMKFEEPKLGPVKAPSLRLASRIANSLRAGHPVSNYDEFDDCDLILISVPDEMLASVLEELPDSVASWREKIVIACSDHAGCEQLAKLARLGAATGTLAMIPGYEDRWLLLEGEKSLERHVRPIVGGLRLTPIASFQKRPYLEALECLGRQFLPCLKEASEGLRTAGIPGAEAAEIVERQVVRIMRSYFRSGSSKVKGSRERAG